MSNRKKKSIGFLVFVIILLLALKLISAWTYQKGLEELERQGNVRLDLYINYLQGVLGKYESLPELLAINKQLVKALQNPHEHKRIETLNNYLETINKVSGTLDTYLMNKDGLTIAASNWHEKRPFIGRNFNYRPYFKEAMKGQLGRYFALGTTSSKRGYYFAYPVRKGDEILGAVAIKISIDAVEKQWTDHNEHFLVTDPDGVVFITTNPQWRYKTLEPLQESTLALIAESRRYPETVFTPLSETAIDTSTPMQILEVEGKTKWKKNRVLKQSRFMPQAGWDVHIFSDTRLIRKKILSVDIIVVIGFSLIFFLVMMFFQRRHRVAEINRIEIEAKKALQESNEQLESRVYDRTLELTETNELLRKEITERKETEVKLKQTRAELIHATKLAVLGEMSAGINHELNQPLAAIRSYTDNGKQFLTKGRHEEAMWNLEQIGELTERMAQIGVQLKLFSRKSSGQITAVPFHTIIDGALEILKPSLKKAGVVLSVDITPKNIEVMGNQVLLQQVLVNLISNAMQATESQSEKTVHVECIKVGEVVTVSVRDNGPGVPTDKREDIFEPFYSTKQSGHGLGLGLTISDRIVRDLGGKIGVVPSVVGAHFEFSLQRAER